MIDVAYQILEQEGKEMKFTDLWEKVKSALEITPEEEGARIGHFYTDLSLTGSVFVLLSDNIWDLRSRHVFAEVKKRRDISSAYTEVDSSDLDSEDAKENAEYDQSMQGGLFDAGVSDTGATDGEGLEDTGKDVSTNDYIGGGSRIGDDY